LELPLTAIDLLAWTRILLLNGALATAEPKKLRYRLLHTAARITRGARRLRLRIAATWPWHHELTTAFHRLAALPPACHVTVNSPLTTHDPRTQEHPATAPSLRHADHPTTAPGPPAHGSHQINRGEPKRRG